MATIKKKATSKSAASANRRASTAKTTKRSVDAEYSARVRNLTVVFTLLSVVFAVMAYMRY